MSRKFKDVNPGHAEVMSTLDPFQVMDFALHHLAQTLSTADGFSLHLDTGSMVVTGTHVDTCDNRSGTVSETPLMELKIDPDLLEDLILWEKFKARHKRRCDHAPEERGHLDQPQPESH